MARTTDEDAPSAPVSPEQATVGIVAVSAVAFLLFAANDNMPGGPDDDDLWENLRRLFDPSF